MGPDAIWVEQLNMEGLITIFYSERFMVTSDQKLIQNQMCSECWGLWQGLPVWLTALAALVLDQGMPTMRCACCHTVWAMDGVQSTLLL